MPQYSVFSSVPCNALSKCGHRLVELQDPHRKGFSIAIDSHILSLTHYERNVSLWVSHSGLILEF